METEALSVQLPGSEGYFGVLPDHAPLFAMLQTGTITIKTDDKVIKLASKDGFAAIANNQIKILVDAASIA